jgi:hypothetical protein
MWYLFLLFPASLFAVIALWRWRQPAQAQQLESRTW